jgi:hypothetical protein
MNRLSFLKTIGVGVAAAVITPKLLIEPPKQGVVKPKPKSYFGKYEDEVKALHYAHYEEAMPRYTVDNLCLWDLCVDKNARPWACTAMMLDTIELTALEADPLPNFIDVERSKFDEYFIIMGNTFKEKN